MVDQNTSITPTPAPQAPAPAPAGYDTVVVNMPPQGQTTTVAVVPATEYQIEAPDVSFTKDGNNLVAHAADGGTVVFEDYFTFASSELPPAMTLADGSVIPQEQIMAELGNPDLNAAEPAAGPGAGAGNTGGLNGSGAAFAAYDPGDIGTGLSVLDLLGNLDLAFAPPPPLQDPGVIDLAEGTLSIEVTTTTTVPEIPGGIAAGDYAGAFEDNQPNAHIGDTTVATPVLNVIFTPADNEVVTQTTLTGFPVGVQLTLSDGTEINITTPDQEVILAGGLETGIQITKLPPNSDADFDVTAVVQIEDTSTGVQTATLTVTGTVVVDAVADLASFETGNVVANEDNATSSGGVYTDGLPRFDIGFAANVNDPDGSEEIVSVSFTLSNLQTTTGVGIVWDGAAVASGDTIEVPASIYGGLPGDTVSMLVTITTNSSGEMIVTLTSQESGGGDDQILDINLAGLQVSLPQHSDDDFTVTASVTTSETNLTDADLTDANNSATQTHSFDVAVLAVADVATDLGATSAVTSGAALVVTEDHTITPTFTANFADNDGSETHTLVLTIPTGWIVVDAGEWTLNADTGKYELDVTGEGASVSVAGPELQPPADSDVDSTLTLTAVSTETNIDGAAALVTAEASATYTIIVDADADEPTDVTASASLSVTTKEGQCQVRNESDWKDVGINVAGVVVTYSTAIGSTAADAASNLVLTTAQGETAVSHATGWGVADPSGTNVHEVDSLGSASDQTSEAIKMTFDSPASTVTINFGLLFGGEGSDWHPESANVEKAILLAYDGDGKLVATAVVQGDQDGKVSYTLDAPEGTTISTVYVVATNVAGESNFSDFIITGAGYTPATETVITEAATVTITASATFGDVVDGSEDHFILVEVPAGSTNVAVEGVAATTFTIGAGGNPAYPGVAPGTYVQVPVDTQLGTGDTSATVHVSFTAPNVTENTTYTLDSYGMAVETVPGTSGSEVDSSDNVAIVAGSTVVVEVADTVPTIVGANSITIGVTEGPAVSTDHGAISFDFGADTTGSTVAFTNAVGEVLNLTGAAGSEEVKVISVSGSTMVVADADGNDITLKVTTATNSCGLVVATITATLPAGDAFAHLSDGNTASVLTISGIDVTGTDNEGSDSVTGHVSVAVTDDLPTLAISVAQSSYTETTSASGSLNVDAGADDLASLTATVNGVAVSLTQSGTTYTGSSAFETLTLNLATNTWSLTGLPNVAVNTSVTVAVTVTDSDTDTATQSTSFTIKDSTPSIVSGNGLILKVNEGDVTSSDHGNIVFSFGKDATDATVTFDYHVGDVLTVTGKDGSETLKVESISMDGTHITVGDGQGNVLELSLTVADALSSGRVTATVSATLTAGEGFDHLTGGGTNSLIIENVKIVGTDDDDLSGGATADTVAAKVSVIVVDDVPSLAAELPPGHPGNVMGVTEGTSVTGSFTLDAGADDLASLKVVVNGGTAVTLASTDGGLTYSGMTAAGLITVSLAGGTPTWTLDTANISENHDYAITFVATDGDGDTASSTVNVTVVDALPKIVGADNVSLTTYENGAHVDAGTVHFEFGTDASGASVKFGDPASLSVNVGGLATGSLTWAVTSDTTLVGSLDGVAVITLSLATVVVGTAIDATVTATLADGTVFNNALGAGAVTVTGLTLIGTDGDTISPDTINADVTVRVVDDVPEVSATLDHAPGNVAAVVEGGTVGGAFTLDGGADGLQSLVATVNGEAVTLTQAAGVFSGSTAAGDLVTVDTTGGSPVWSIQTANIDGVYTPTTVSFTATDADGDTATSATLNYIVVDGVPTIDGSGDITIKVSETGLGDSSNASESASGVITFHAGTDATSVGFGTNFAGITVQGLHNPASLTWSLVGGNLVGSMNGTEVLTLSLSTGSIGATTAVTVTATLDAAFAHENNVNVDQLTITGIQVTATDADHDTATADVTIKVADDVPKITATGGGIAGFYGGEIHLDAGADGLASLSVSSGGTTYTLTQLASGVYGNASLYGGIIVNLNTGSWFAMTHPLSSLTFTATDTDGDSDSYTVPFGTGAWFGPHIDDSGLDLSVAEDGLGKPATTEVDSGTIAVSAGLRPASVSFGSDFSGIHVSGLEGTGISWSVAGNTLTGSIGGTAVIALTLGGATSLSSYAHGDVTVTATLDQAFATEHQINIDAVKIDGIPVVIADSTHSSSTTVSVEVVDDVPEIAVHIPDAPGNVSIVTEGDTLAGGAFSIDAGADGLAKLEVTVNGTTTLMTLSGGVYSAATAAGLITVSGGSWSVDTANVSGTATNYDIVFTVTDGDGDTADSGVAHLVVVDSIPLLSDATIALSMHEGAAPTTDAETVTFDFGRDIGTSSVTLDSSAITVAGVAPGTIVWTLAGNILTGAIGGEDVLKITLTTAAGAEADQINATVTAELLDGPIANSLGAGALNVSGIQIVGSDGEESVSASVSVSVSDGVPSLSATMDGAYPIVSEGQTIGGDFTLNPGSDGVGELKMTVDGVTATLTSSDGGNTYTGTVNGSEVVVNTVAGSWTLATGNVTDPSSEHHVSFSVVDADGDTAGTETFTYMVLDGVPKIVGTGDIHLSVDEDGSKSSDSANITFNFGTDATGATVTFGNLVGSSLTMSGAAETLTVLRYNPDGSMVVGDTDGNELTLSLSTTDGSTYTVTATLADGAAFDHTVWQGENTLTIGGIEIVGTDGDGDIVSTTASVAVTDDTLAITTPSATTVGSENDASLSGAFNVVGADDVGSLSVKVGGTTYVMDKSGGVFTTDITGVGHLTVDTVGDTWELVPSGVSANKNTTLSFSAVDGDGDTATATVKITVNDGVPTVDHTAISLAVTEGSATPDSQAIVFDFGRDDGAEGGSTSVAFGSTTGISVTGLASDSLVWTTASDKLYGKLADGTLIVTVTIAALTSSQYTIEAALADDAALNHTDTTVSVTGISVVGTDSDGDTVATQVSLTIADDTPTIVVDHTDIAPLSGHIDTTDAIGFLSVSIGAETLNLEQVGSTSEYHATTSAGEISYDSASHHWAMSLVDPSAQLSVTLTATDADGDTTSNTMLYAGDTGGVTGTDANETLIGSANADVLDGAGGNDVLIGGGGDDILTGGEGADTFKFTSVTDGRDTITDFQVGTGGDTIDLDALFDALGAAAANTEVTVTPVSGSTTQFTIGLADATTHVAVHTEFSIDVHTTTDTDAAAIKAQVDTHGS